MVFKMVCFRIFQSHVRQISNSPKLSAASHYDVLGLSPKATQGDVKSAYYKLSMTYHPDKNKGSDEAANKFRDITAAYEVLGNVKLRKLYDKGMISGTTSQGFPRPTEDPTSKFYKSRDVRSRPPHPSGRQTVYDFDEWTRAHYGATFRRDQMNRQNRSFAREQRIEMANDIKMERIVITVIVLFFVSWYITVSTVDYDAVNNVEPIQNQNKKS